MNKKILKTTGVLFLVFIIFTAFVGLNFFSRVDLLTTIIMQGILPRVFDIPFSLLSLVGSAEIVSIFILILWFIYRKLNIIFVLINFAMFHVIELFSKSFITHLGPPHQFLRYYFPFNFPSSSVKPGSSFPSGHVGRTMFVSILLIFIVSKSSKLTKKQKQLIFALIIIFDILMALSRVYLGEHWLSDVIGGGFLGSAFGLVSLLTL